MYQWISKYLVKAKIRSDLKEKHSSRSAQKGGDDGGIATERRVRFERSGNQHETARRRFVVTYTNASTSNVLLPNTREYRCATRRISMNRIGTWRQSPWRTRFHGFHTCDSTCWHVSPLRIAFRRTRRRKCVQLYRGALMRTKEMWMRSAIERMIGRTSVWPATIKHKYRSCVRTYMWRRLNKANILRLLKLMYFSCKKWVTICLQK